MAIDGLDVSAQQGTVDWSITPGILGIAKATEGTYYQDSQFHANTRGLVNANKRPGGYHFIRAGINWADQAHYFMDWMNAGYVLNIGIYALDLEPYPGEPWPYGPDETVANALLFLQTFQQTAAGIVPWLYTYPSFMQMMLASPHAHDLSEFPLWWADPSNINPAPWPPALIQTGQGTVPGVAGTVDLNSLGPAYQSTLQPTHQPKDESMYLAHNPSNPDEIWQFGDEKRHLTPDEYAFRTGPFGGNPWSNPPGGAYNVLTISQEWFDSVPVAGTGGSGSGGAAPTKVVFPSVTGTIS